MWTGSNSGGKVVGSCECGNELSGSRNAGNFSTSCESKFIKKVLLHGISLFVGFMENIHRPYAFFFNFCLPKTLLKFQVSLLCLLFGKLLLKSYDKT